jgi:hypothetical protein
MTHKLGICIPYRNRQEHLDRLVPHLSNYLNERGIEHKFYVGHQVDDNLFNRGMMKNIAAKFAFDDGCDYIAWHDVDMLAYTKHMDTLPDYSYPKDNPIHIATKLSKYQYGLGYDQYFGGVVLFTKEHVERTNGYSNEYWDWGQEDDDLFWRCYYENYVEYKISEEHKDRGYIQFNGENSLLRLGCNREISSALNGTHTVSVLFYPEQQNEKVPIWLVGDPARKFIEYPILRKEGGNTWGLSFNNSRAVTFLGTDKSGEVKYNWAKRQEGFWTRVTYKYDKPTGKLYYYVNDELETNVNGIKENESIYIGEMKNFDSVRPFTVGYCPNQNTYFKGKVAEIKIYNEENDLVMDYDYTNEYFEIDHKNVEYGTEDINVIGNILPYRREGSFYCLSHTDEGFVNGTWAKGETTAKNERRFVTQMQQKKIDYKNDGYLQIMDKLTIQSIEENPYNCLNTTLINVTTDGQR